MSTVEEPLPVVLAGARGHGRQHLTNIARLQKEGLVRLAGVCELRPLSPDELAGLDGFDGSAAHLAPEQGQDLDALLASTGARIVVVCTPIQTHTDLALTAARHGAHLLLEKPPAPSYEEFRRMADGVARAGVVCQVGFQSLGSHALPAVRALVEDGVIGEVRGVGAAGAWVRGEAYFRRSPWAGRRRLDGVDVVDGVLTNPLAHAVSTALALDGSTRAEEVAGVEAELFRANDIESDDTSCVRVATSRGGRVTVAATLCAEVASEPYVVVHGSSGRITFWYKQDRVLVQRSGHGPHETVHGRTDLLENLVRHLTRGDALLVPPDVCGAFMRVVEAVRTAPEPVRLPPDAWRQAEEGNAPRRVVPGIDALVAAGAESLRLYSELGAPWALSTEVTTP